MRVQAGSDISVVLGTQPAFGDEDFCWQAKLSRFGQSWRVGNVRDHDGDLDALESSFADRVGDREEVRSATGEKNAEPDCAIFIVSSQAPFPQGLKPRSHLALLAAQVKPCLFKNLEKQPQILRLRCAPLRMTAGWKDLTCTAPDVRP